MEVHANKSGAIEPECLPTVSTNVSFASCNWRILGQLRFLLLYIVWRFCAAAMIFTTALTDLTNKYKNTTSTFNILRRRHEEDV